MAQSWAESTRDTYICRHKMSIMFNEICINEEMLPKYTYIYIYIYKLTNLLSTSKDKEKETPPCQNSEITNLESLLGEKKEKIVGARYPEEPF